MVHKGEENDNDDDNDGDDNDDVGDKVEFFVPWVECIIDKSKELKNSLPAVQKACENEAAIGSVADLIFGDLDDDDFLGDDNDVEQLEDYYDIRGDVKDDDPVEEEEEDDLFGDDADGDDLFGYDY